jgi:hypothetical protein
LSGKNVAWVMNVAPLRNHPNAWIPRYREQAFGPTNYHDAVAAAKRMAEPVNGHDVASLDAHLNFMAAKFVDAAASDHSVEPKARGLRVRIAIESEKDLQILGCGWRVVTCQFRGTKVLLHHNGNAATMKRKAFKDLIEATRRARYGEPQFVRTIADEVAVAA